eukprot:7671617-Pyramimonas_sp.AAC.1
MAVWSRSVAEKTRSSTAGFVGDSSINARGPDLDEVLNNGKRALAECEEFGKYTGCRLNKSKTKALASTSQMRNAVSYTHLRAHETGAYL